MPEITSKQVMTLRTKTGAGIMDCKNALKETQGDLDKAVEVLRKKGLSGLAKRAGREMKEGIVRVKAENGRYAMVEINCETDFVAKNPDVAGLADSLLDDLLSGKCADAAADEDCKKKLQDIAMKVGENMTIRRSVVYESGDSEVVNYYLHGDSKKAALVKIAFSGNSPSAAEELKGLAKELAMQAVAMSPSWLSREDVPSETIEKEKEIYKASPKAQGKSEIALSKMLEGRIKKFYEENCLLEQNSIRDSKKKISDIVKDASAKTGGEVKVVRFDSYIVGME